MLFSYRTLIALGLLVMLALEPHSAEAGRRRRRRRRRRRNGGNRLSNDDTPFGWECKGETLDRLIGERSGLTLDKYACITDPNSKFSVTCSVLFEEVGVPLTVDLECKRHGWRRVSIRSAPTFGGDLNFSTATLTVSNVTNASSVDPADILSALQMVIPSAGGTNNFVIVDLETNSDDDELTFTFIVATVFFDLDAACELEAGLENDAEAFVDALADAASDNFDSSSAMVLRKGFSVGYAFGICPSP